MAIRVACACNVKSDDRRNGRSASETMPPHGSRRAQIEALRIRGCTAFTASVPTGILGALGRRALYDSGQRAVDHAVDIESAQNISVKDHQTVSPRTQPNRQIRIEVGGENIDEIVARAHFN